MIILHLPYAIPLTDQLFERPGGIGGTRRRQADRRPSGNLLCVFPVIFVSRLPVDTDSPDVCFVQDEGKVIRYDISDRRIRRTLDIAGVDDIPDRNVIAEQKSLLLRDRLRDLFFENSGNYFPETVLRMSVKEISFPGLDRREASEDKYPRCFIKYGRYRMDDHLFNVSYCLISFSWCRRSLCCCSFSKNCSCSWSRT